MVYNMETSQILSSSESIVSFSSQDIVREKRLSDMKDGYWLRSVENNVSDIPQPGGVTVWRNLLPTIIPNLGKLPKPSPNIDVFPEQKFEGEVVAIYPEENVFWSRLSDKTSKHPDEDVELSFSEVPFDDHNLIVPGALFSWTIYRETRDKQVRRVSEIRFRRGIAFSKGSVALAIESATNLFAILNTIDNEPSSDPSITKRD